MTANRGQSEQQRRRLIYFLDKELGLMHVRLQTWAPFACQGYANGHDFVARQLKKGLQPTLSGSTGGGR